MGFGRLGRACADAVRDHGQLELVGIVHTPGAGGAVRVPAARSVPAPIEAHVRDLDRVEVVLLCVPVAATQAVARELLQQRFAVVECAQVEPERREAYCNDLADSAARHRAKIMTGAGWDPGVLAHLREACEMLIPRGHTQFTRRPAASLHHTATAAAVTGVAGALAVEHPATDGSARRYVYVELARGARLERVARAIVADPAFAGESTEVFAVDSLAALQEEAQGVLLERLGTAASGAHQSLLFEARGDPAVFAARVMADAARWLPRCPVGGHRFFLGG